MNNDFEHLIRKAGEQVSLTTEERARARALLTEYAAMKPMRTATPHVALPGILHRFSRPAFASATALLMLSLTTGGITYAAEGSLPGDLLYGVKVAVTEPVVSALTTRGEAQAHWQMTLAERRVHEAAALASTGRLDTKTETALAVQFTVAADSAATAVAEEPDPVSATVAITGFATRLAAYDTVLKKSANGTGSTTLALRTAVHAQLGSWNNEQPHSSAKDLEKLERKAATALQDSANTIGQAGGTLNASNTKSANEALKEASRFAEEGREQLKEHDDEGASKSFRASIEASARLDVLTRAASTLQINAFGNEEDGEHTDATGSVQGTNTFVPN